jgi:hypothetical protein
VRNDEILDGPTADQMLLDDALEIRLVTMSVPDSFWVDDGDGAFCADPQAIGFRTKDGVFGVDASEFLEALLEELPGRLLFTGGGTVAAYAEKDMALVVAEVQFGRDAFEALDRGSFTRHRHGEEHSGSRPFDDRGV